MIEVLAIKEAMNLALQCERRKAGFLSHAKFAIESIMKNHNWYPLKVYVPHQRIDDKRKDMTSVLLVDPPTSKHII